MPAPGTKTFHEMQSEPDDTLPDGEGCVTGAFASVPPTDAPPLNCAVLNHKFSWHENSAALTG